MAKESERGKLRASWCKEEWKQPRGLRTAGWEYLGGKKGRRALDRESASRAPSARFARSAGQKARRAACFRSRGGPPELTRARNSSRSSARGGILFTGIEI